LRLKTTEGGCYRTTSVDRIVRGTRLFHGRSSSCHRLDDLAFRHGIPRHRLTATRWQPRVASSVGLLPVHQVPHLGGSPEGGPWPCRVPRWRPSAAWRMVESLFGGGCPLLYNL